MAKAQAVIGVFDDFSEAQAVIDDLNQHGFETRSLSRQAAGQAGGAGAAMATDPARAFEGIEISKDERNHYEERLNEGRCIVIAKASGERAREAADIMMRYGAGKEEEALQEGPVEAIPPREEAFAGREELKEEATIPVVEEELKVGKRAVRRGGVRIYSHTEEVPVEEDITLKSERVTVERRPVDRPAGPGDVASGVTEITETVEEPVVSKEARVVEEVVVGREETERTETIKDTVKKTEIDVERMGEEVDRFGREFAADRRYAGKDWNEVEPEMRRSWEEKHAGTWNDIKDRFKSFWHRRHEK
ncbi:MAG TPA: YsnF/AvaK domain-containing protein [Bryobacteraceae bacterium]|nr:YsnF/AvaK domain-containing protein [Bryobacteraceae bacterium]HPQ15825.1 YsnF/AvaK domain-containing protein [Bryobacteraceae bacterium]HPU71888.1 YsnF/AvaK domain-containing protein [Bryobacteraceae bacterium]